MTNSRAHCRCGQFEDTDHACPVTHARLKAEIEGAHHDIDRLMAACTAEANEVQRLRAARQRLRAWALENGKVDVLDLIDTDGNQTMFSSASPSEPEVGEPFQSVIKAQADTIGVLARRVVRMGNPLRDHACPQCVPEGGDMVNYGFVCAYHLASYLVTCPEYQLPGASRDASSGEG